jgi:Lamin Tail Domain/Secretion system C-terminal sorting domain
MYSSQTTKQRRNFAITIMKLPLIVLSLALLWSGSLKSQNLNLRINEILTRNRTIQMDDFFEYDDWIEIYNPPGSAITNLAGYYLSDNPDSLTKWQIPADDAGVTTVLPNNFIAFWIDNDYDNLNSQGPSHNAGFSLDSDGEMILLTAPDGTTIIDSTSFPEMAPDVSWGRSCDGCPQWQYFNHVTFEDNNIEIQNNSLLFINEVQAINASTYDDLESEFDPWIEIYNPNNFQVNAANYSISINGETLWTIPNTRPVRTVIPPGGFLLIWCDNDITDDVNHSPLELLTAGASIQLNGPDGTTAIDSYSYPAAVIDHSWGRASDGASASIDFSSPTPTVTNQLIVIQPANVVINELLTANQTGITDNVGELEDWIEIYNPTNTPINLGGYYLSDDPEVRNKWVIPSAFPDSVTVPAQGWLLFWADADVEQGVRHADFRLSNNGEYLSLAGPDGYTLADEIQWNYIAPDTSLGRLTDGSEEWVLFIVSTPDASNNQGTINVLENTTSDVTAYPNPAQGMVYFNKPVNAIILDISGKTIGSINNDCAITASNWAPGIYFVRLSNGSTIRIIKN